MDREMHAVHSPEAQQLWSVMLSALQAALWPPSNRSTVLTASAEFNSTPVLLVFLFLILLRTVTKEKRPLEPAAQGKPYPAVPRCALQGGARVM